jgi:hypothetical protein
VLLLAALYFLIRLPWLFMVPMLEAPDEFSHYWVFKFLADHMRLPDPQEVAAGGPSAVYGSLPQLGYIPHVIICKLFPIGDLSLVGRFGSLFMGLICVLMSYYLALELFAENMVCAIALPLMLMFHPQFVLVCAYSNTDTTTCALTTTLMVLFCRMIKRGADWKQAVWMGFLLGWVALSKYSGYAIYPTALFAVAAAFVIHRYSVKQMAVFTLALGSSFAATCLWWFWRNYQIYNGDFLGTQTMYRSWALTYHRSLSFHMTPWAVMKQRAWWRMTAFSYWGMFGYMNKYLWRPLYFGYIAFMIIAIAGGGSRVLMPLFQKRSGKLFESRKSLIMPAIWISLLICVAANLAAMVAASTINLGGPQGRYLFPSEAAFMALLIGGLWSMGKQSRKWFVIAAVAYNFIVCVWSFAMLFPLYGFHTKIM